MTVRHEDDYLSLSALNHFLFCQRRAALIHIEQIYVHNVYTLEGVAGHKRVHQETDWNAEAGVREVRSMRLICHRLGLVGKSDLVEFHPQPDGSEVPLPVEYKRGQRRRWDNDDVQLCAQALCLEEMLDVRVPAGAIFHVKSRRRREVVFGETLRRKTEQTAHRLHELVASGVTPPAVLKPQCQGCSLRELCMPQLMEQTEKATNYVQQLYCAEGVSGEL